MDSGEENSNLEIKNCFVKVKKLSMEDFDSDSSSSIDLPPVACYISSKSSKRSAKSTAELLEEHQNLVKNIQIENLSNSNIEETLRTLEVAHSEEVGGSSSSSSPVFSPQEKKDFKIFCNIDSLQFFNADDVTPLECGYKNRCLDSFPVNIYETEMLSFRRVELQYALPSFLFSSNVCCISDCKSFTTYLMRVMSVYEDVACIEACYNAVIMLLRKHPEAENLTFTSAEIFMLLFNYGVDVDEFQFLQKWPNFKTSLETPQWQRKKSNKIPKKWAFNLKFILKVIMELIPSCSFKTKDLSKIAIFFLYMSLDSTLLQENLYSSVRECIYICLENVPKDDWNEIVCEINEMLMSMEFSSVQLKWKNVTQMTDTIPNRCERGIHLRKHISFSALRRLCFKTSDVDENSVEFTVNNLCEYLQKLVEVDSDLLSYATKFVDICIRHLSFSKEDNKLLCNTLKQCEKCFDKSSHEVTTHLIKIYTKLKHFGRKFTYKISHHESHIKIKKEIEDDHEKEIPEGSPSIAHSTSIKVEPFGHYLSSASEVNEYNSENDSQDENFHSLSSSDSENSNSRSNNVLLIKTENLEEPDLSPNSTEDKPPIKLLLKKKERSGNSKDSGMLNTVTDNDDVSKQSSSSEYELVNNQCLPQRDAQTVKECTELNLYTIPISNFVKDEPNDYCDSAPVSSGVDEIEFAEDYSLQSEIYVSPEKYVDESLVECESKLPEICEVRSIFESNAKLLSPSSSFVDGVCQDKKLEVSLSDSKSFYSNKDELSISSEKYDQTLPIEKEAQLPGICGIKSVNSFPRVKNVGHASGPELSFPHIKSFCSNNQNTGKVIDSSSNSALNSVDHFNSIENTHESAVIKLPDVEIQPVFSDNTKVGKEASYGNFPAAVQDNHKLSNSDDEIIIIQEKASPIKSKNSPKITESFSDARDHSVEDTDIVIVKVVESPKKNKQNISSKENPNAVEESGCEEIWLDNDILSVTECDIQINNFETKASMDDANQIDSDDSDVAVIDAQVPAKAFIPICVEVLNYVLDSVDKLINDSAIHSVDNTSSLSVDVDAHTENALYKQVGKICVADSNTEDLVANSTSSHSVNVDTHIENTIHIQVDKNCIADSNAEDLVAISPLSLNDVYEQKDKVLQDEDVLDFEKIINPVCNLSSVSDEDEFLYSEDNLDNTKPFETDYSVKKDNICDTISNENIPLNENLESNPIVSNKELSIDTPNVFPNTLKKDGENIGESKRKEHSRKQSKPLKRKHETEILMLDFDRNKKDRIDQDVTHVINGLVSSSVALSESYSNSSSSVQNSEVCVLSKASLSSKYINSSQLKSERFNIEAFNNDKPQTHSESYSTMSIEEPETEISECITSLVSAIEDSAVNDSVLSNPKLDKLIFSDLQPTGARKTFQNKNASIVLETETSSEKNSEMTKVTGARKRIHSSLKILDKSTGAVKSFQKRNKMNEEMPATRLSLSPYNRGVENRDSLPTSSKAQKSLPNVNVIKKHILPKGSGAKKSFQKRKNSELPNSSPKIRKYDSTSYRNENEHDGVVRNEMYSSPKKLSPQKSPLSAKYCLNKSPKKFYDYAHTKHKYISIKTTTNKSILNKTGLNLTNILKEKVMPLDTDLKPVILLNSDDSDIVELYTDPKRYCDKECLIVYESEDIVVLD